MIAANRESLGIDSFGVSITTLEEVFMKAGEMAETKEAEKAGNGIAAANDAKRGSRDDLVINDDIESNRRAEGSEIHPDRMYSLVYYIFRHDVHGCLVLFLDRAPLP